jgi:MarR family transcriptional regulator, organic hydroperoxide resistance regulator
MGFRHMIRAMHIKKDVFRELPDVLQFMRLLWELEHALQKTSKRMASSLGVTGLQRLVLRILGLFPGIAAGEIATILHVHPSTLTGVLSRLMDHGLIVRSTYEGDRRRAVLALTARGRRVNGIKKGTVEAAVEKALRDTSRQDRSVARRVLSTVCEALEADTG